MLRLRALVPAFVVAMGALWASSCSPSGFAEATMISSVRILASSADQPYAKPGATVSLQVLAYDGRATRSAPMTLYWLPFVCENPQDDAYFACFAKLAGGTRSAGDAGADGGGGAAGPAPGPLRPGVDLTPLLPSGPSYRFTMPADATTSHPPVPGTRVPYGLAILFNMACAGHLELIPIDPGNINPQTLPIGCFDASHRMLGPDDYVFGFTRVYAYDKLTNDNPVIEHFDVQGQTLAVQGAGPAYETLGFTTARCTADNGDNCAHIKIGPAVPVSSWETNPEDVDGSGNPRHEQIWADFFATFGSFTSSARLLYDVTAGSLGDPGATDNEFLPPSDPGSGVIWVVVHDNRGGASWATIPVTVR
jgi:hypothetical protein